MTTYRLTRSWADPRMQSLAEWTATMMGEAGASAAKLGRSREAMVAQAAQESFWGAASIGFNIFGIKADASWRGKRRVVQTIEYVDDGAGNRKPVRVEAWFRDYDSYAQSFEDHLSILYQDNFVAAGVFAATSDYDYFKALKRGGYATDPEYAEHLVMMLSSVKIFTANMVADDAPPPALPPRLLKIGTDGPDVEALQLKLSIDEQGFGQATLAAVLKFQRAEGLVADGIVGPITRAALGL